MAYDDGVMDDALTSLLQDIRQCRICADALAHEPRPVLRAERTARLVICGQAPGTRVHASGIPFNDPSGVRLREWLDMDPDTFYDSSRVAIVPMGFCFPGQDAKGGDLPPRRECAPQWHEKVRNELPAVRLTVLVGRYSQAFYLGRGTGSLTETVKNWREYMPAFFPLPHPSWRNNAWLKRNPWFAEDVLPELHRAVRSAFEVA
ncbi:MAG TPA: uracil-DNA glycosylase family protein [Alphaproteobacteria bacterium]|nr:uracil-DNA glycosylase family protein [Alphaproteobacteria bacterium]